MNIINTKSIAATIILAASIPAFAQSRGHGSDRGAGNRGPASSGRAQFGQQRQFNQGSFDQGSAPRNDSFRNRPAPQMTQRQFAQPNNFRGNNATRFESRPRISGFGGSRRVIIPQNRFYSSFGRNHYFRVGRPVFYGRYPRFQYGGFWFNFAAAAPAYWGPDWYYNDDVYIDYSNGGYYLYDNRYPGQGIPLDVDNGDYGGNDGYDNSYDGGYNNSYPSQY